VLAFDDVAGIYYSEGEYIVLLEGNEESFVRELPGIILDRITLADDLVELSTFSLGRERSPVREYTTIFFLLSIFLVGGIFIGFNIVDDRQSGSIRALAVSPINALEYMLGKSVLGLVVVLFLSLLVTWILLGFTGVNYLSLLISVVASLGVAVIIGLSIGLVSSNMITAIAIIKVLALYINLVTIAALFMPDRLKWLLYLFPNYWSVEAFNRILIRTDLPLAPVNLAAALLGIAVVFVLVSRFGHELRLTIKAGK
jgi:ABC-2 type transport system permease protein